jgi:hypothetical protein
LEATRDTETAGLELAIRQDAALTIDALADAVDGSEDIECDAPIEAEPVTIGGNMTVTEPKAGFTNARGEDHQEACAQMEAEENAHCTDVLPPAEAEAEIAVELATAQASAFGVTIMDAESVLSQAKREFRSVAHRNSVWTTCLALWSTPALTAYMNYMSYVADTFFAGTYGSLMGSDPDPKLRSLTLTHTLTLTLTLTRTRTLTLTLTLTLALTLTLSLTLTLTRTLGQAQII